jgi:hypothetical protein
MSKFNISLFALILAMAGGAAALAHGGGGGGGHSSGGGGGHFSGGGGGHMSMSHMSSFHSSPSFHSSSFSSFHSSSFQSSPSFHSSSFGASHPSDFRSLESGSNSNFNSESPSTHISRPETGVGPANSEQGHHGFLFFGHHDHNQVSTISGDGLSNSPNAANAHHGFLFFGHHNHSAQALGDPLSNAQSTVMAHHNGYHQFGEFNTPPMNPHGPSFVINMAPPIAPVPIHSVAITKYFYSPSPQIPYYGYQNNGIFGSYGSTYGGYGYSPNTGMTSLLFRLLSLLGMGGYHNYGSRGLGSTAFLGSFGPSSSFNYGSPIPLSPTDDGATNFVDNYNTFNYTGGNVTPFANLLPPGTAYGGDPPNPDNQLAANQPAQDPAPFQQENFAYHYQGVLGSAFSQDQILPADSYHAPELLGIVFTHQFWDAQSQAPDASADAPVDPPVASQN